MHCNLKTNEKIFILLLFAVHISAFAQFPELAITPPMGWNSWNAFGLNINYRIVFEVADSMAAEGMKDAGYVAIDARTYVEWKE